MISGGKEALTAPEPLAPDHELDGFESGVAMLDEWLGRRARRNDAEGASRTFVLCAGRRVVGYYSLAAGSILHTQATGKVRRNMPNPVPVLLLGRLAVDRAWQGKGLGRTFCPMPFSVQLERRSPSGYVPSWFMRSRIRPKASMKSMDFAPPPSSR